MRQHEHADVGVAATDLLGRDEAVVAVAGRHPDVHDRHVRLARLDHAEQRLGVTAPADDVEAGVLEHPGEALAQQRLVVGDHEAHGISTLSWPSHTVSRPADRTDPVLDLHHGAVGRIARVDHQAQPTLLDDRVDRDVAARSSRSDSTVAK